MRLSATAQGGSCRMLVIWDVKTPFDGITRESIENKRASKQMSCDFDPKARGSETRYEASVTAEWRNDSIGRDLCYDSAFGKEVQ